MPTDPRTTLSAILAMWSGAPVDGLGDLVTPDYRGHMLHLQEGERDAASYPARIERYRAANPGTTFRAVEQLVAEGRLVTRIEARRPAGPTAAPVVAMGINISRFSADGRLAEEWAVWSSWLDDPAALP